MRRRRTAISALFVTLAAASAAAQDVEELKVWGKRERPPADQEAVRTEKTVCPVCDLECERVTYTSIAEYEWDTDYKVIRAAFNIYPYVLTTCPRCSYTTYGFQFHKPLSDEQKTKVGEALREIRVDYPDYWAVPVSYSIQAAVATQRALGGEPGTLYEIYILGSYLARDAQQAGAERLFQSKALHHLKQALESDADFRRPKLYYMAGELSRRLEFHKEALEWFVKARSGANEEFVKLISRQELKTRDDMDARKKPAR